MVIGIVHFEREPPLAERAVIDHLCGSVHPGCVLEAGDHEEQCHVGVGVDILVGLEKAVSLDIREDQVAVVDHLDEPGPSALWRGVAVPLAVRTRQNTEGRVADEILHPGMHVVTDLRRGALSRESVMLLKPVGGGAPGHRRRVAGGLAQAARKT